MHIDGAHNQQNTEPSMKMLMLTSVNAWVVHSTFPSNHGISRVLLKFGTKLIQDDYDYIVHHTTRSQKFGWDEVL